MTVCPPALDSGLNPVELINALKNEPDFSHPVLSKCAGCFLCDNACPYSCKPYSLVREHWNRRYEEEGLPARVAYFLPHNPVNFRSKVNLSDAERKRIAEWETNTKKDLSGKDVLYTGCNLFLMSGLIDTPLFDDLTPAGSYDLCCGEMYFRMGLHHLAMQSAHKIKTWIEERGIRKLVVACSGCYSMLAGIYPERFDVDLGIPIIFITDWLKERIDPSSFTGGMDLPERIVIQNPCHSNIEPDSLKKSPVELLEAAGITVDEAESAVGGCCGIGTAASEFSALRTFSVSRRRWKELRSAAKGDTIVTTCGGCLLTLTSCSTAGFGEGGMIHLLDLLSRLLGFEPEVNITHNVKSMLIGMLPVLLWNGRFQINSLEKLEEGKTEPYEK